MQKRYYRVVLGVDFEACRACVIEAGVFETYVEAKEWARQAKGMKASHLYLQDPRCSRYDAPAEAMRLPIVGATIEMFDEDGTKDSWDVY